MKTNITKIKIPITILIWSINLQIMKHNQMTKLKRLSKEMLFPERYNNSLIYTSESLKRVPKRSAIGDFGVLYSLISNQKPRMT